MEKALPNPILFYWHDRRSDLWWYMSNFAYTPFMAEGILYLSSEQWLMAHKAALFGDSAMVEKMIKPQWTGPANIEQWSQSDFDRWTAMMNYVKMCGRKVAGFDKEIWAQHAISIMVEGLIFKFKTRPSLLQGLLSTGNNVLAEASEQDPIWGIGMWEKDYGTKYKQFNGTNWLGISLMTVRTLFHKKLL